MPARGTYFACAQSMQRRSCGGACHAPARHNACGGRRAAFARAGHGRTFRGSRRSKVSAVLSQPLSGRLSAPPRRPPRPTEEGTVQIRYLDDAVLLVGTLLIRPGTTPSHPAGRAALPPRGHRPRPPLCGAPAGAMRVRKKVGERENEVWYFFHPSVEGGGRLGGAPSLPGTGWGRHGRGSDAAGAAASSGRAQPIESSKTGAESFRRAAARGCRPKSAFAYFGRKQSMCPAPA